MVLHDMLRAVRRDRADTHAGRATHAGWMPEEIVNPPDASKARVSVRRIALAASVAGLACHAPARQDMAAALDAALGADAIATLSIQTASDGATGSNSEQGDAAMAADASPPAVVPPGWVGTWQTRFGHYSSPSREDPFGSGLPGNVETVSCDMSVDIVNRPGFVGDLAT